MNCLTGEYMQHQSKKMTDLLLVSYTGLILSVLHSCKRRTIFLTSVGFVCLEFRRRICQETGWH